MPFIRHTPEEVRQMLDVIGIDGIDALFEPIPAALRAKPLNLPKGASEADVCAALEARSASPGRLTSFLGAGYYAHVIPKAVDALAGRSEFVTSYTPYQAECSQGTLQAIFEFQTAVCRLFGMDCANASVYDGGTALFEAAMMAMRITRRQVIVVDECVNPLWRRMLATYIAGQSAEVRTVPHRQGASDLAALADAIDGNCAAVLVQQPTFFGTVEDYGGLFPKAHAQGTLGVISVYPVLQAVLRTPGESGADIAVAEGQSLGLPLSFGGPYLGIMTCRKPHVRQLPGRIVGRTVDREGRTAYVLTLQAREQHIRRAKATSNICSNQALCALRSLIHLSLLGPGGLEAAAMRSMSLARRTAERATALPGVTRINDAPFGNEVALRFPIPARDIVRRAADFGIAAGYPAGEHYPGLEDVLLVACTEANTEDDVDRLITTLATILGERK
jgi:glycine dehydrogenase subunit 1